MRPELEIDASLDRLTRAIARHASARDADGAFPRQAFAELEARGLLSHPPAGAETMKTLLPLLAAVGRGDLSAGRIYEGHVNACFLIERYGTGAQRERFAASAKKGQVFGVWNTDAPGEPLRLANGELSGKKAFASGVDGLSHAIVTITDQNRRRMIAIPVRDPDLDRSWWRPLGMRASGSHVVDLTGLRVAPEWMLGEPDDYVEQPWFSAGAIRFLAVHVGGMHAVFDAAASHLRRTDRAADPHQSHRLARMGVAVQGGYLWLDRCAGAWIRAASSESDAAAKRYMAGAANGARLAVETAAMALLEDAERAIGAAGMLAPHPFERLMRDMRTYLRQPDPDGAAAAFGASIAKGEWAPGPPHSPEQS